MNSGKDISKDSDCILLSLCVVKPFSTPPALWPFFLTTAPSLLPTPTSASLWGNDVYGLFYSANVVLRISAAQQLPLPDQSPLVPPRWGAASTGCDVRRGCGRFRDMPISAFFAVIKVRGLPYVTTKYILDFLMPSPLWSQIFLQI